MSNQMRDVPKLVTICDLCEKEIPKHEHSSDVGSITHGYIAHKVTPVTKRVWLHWPLLNKPGASYEQNQAAREKRVEYDFHAECIVGLVQAAIAERDAKWKVAASD